MHAQGKHSNKIKERAYVPGLASTRNLPPRLVYSTKAARNQVKSKDLSSFPQYSITGLGKVT